MENYISRGLFFDPDYSDGFRVIARRHGRGGVDVTLGEIKFPGSGSETPWMLEQWHSRHCIWRERYESDNPFVIENSAKRVEVRPEENLISMRLDGAAEYAGRGHTDKRTFWPHLLLEQCMLNDFSEYPQDLQKFYSADCDRMVLNTDIRITDFKRSEVRRGILACQFMAYFYLTLKGSRQFIYFGADFFDSRGLMGLYWKMDVMGDAMIYLLPTEESFNSPEDVFCRESEKLIDPQRWRHVSLDLTPHIDRIVERANRENIFGRQVSRGDFYIRGTNIGFETHGNYDCTIEVKNYNIISYVKSEK